MKILWNRLISPTPAFWRKVQKCAAGALALVVALQAGATAPAWLVTALPYGFTALTTVVAVAQFTCSDSPADQIPS